MNRKRNTDYGTRITNYEMDDLSMKNVAAGLAGRLRSLALVLDRLDRLESGSGAWLAGFNENELPEAATALTLRAFRAGADPTNFAILKALTAGESQKMADLIAAVGIGRLPLSERLNDLVQVGLASRLIDTDHAQITAAGAAIAQLIDDLTGWVVEQYRHKEEKLNG